MATSQTLKSWTGRTRPSLSPRRSVEAASLVALFTLVVVSAGVGGWFSGLINTHPARYGDTPPPPTIEDYRVGAIMFVPTKGPNCELYKFDNLTGAVAADGTINCERKLNPAYDDAFAPGTERAVRMKAILNTFKK